MLSPPVGRSKCLIGGCRFSQSQSLAWLNSFTLEIGIWIEILVGVVVHSGAVRRVVDQLVQSWSELPVDYATNCHDALHIRSYQPGGCRVSCSCRQPSGQLQVRTLRLRGLPNQSGFHPSWDQTMRSVGWARTSVTSPLLTRSC